MAVSRLSLKKTNDLIEAVKNKDIEAASFLLANGANSNAEHVYFYNRPLALAILNNDLEMVKLLRAYGVNLNATDTLGNHYAHFAAYWAGYHKDNSIINLLYPNPGVYFPPNIYGVTPTHFYNDGYTLGIFAPSKAFLPPSDYVTCMRDHLKQIIYDLKVGQAILSEDIDINVKQTIDYLSTTDLDALTDDQIVNAFTALVLVKQNTYYTFPQLASYYESCGVLLSKYNESVAAQKKKDSLFERAMHLKNLVPNPSIALDLFLGGLSEIHHRRLKITAFQDFVKVLEIDPGCEEASTQVKTLLLQMNKEELRALNSSEIISAIKLLPIDVQISLLSSLDNDDKKSDWSENLKPILSEEEKKEITNYLISIDPDYLKNNPTPQAYINVGNFYHAKGEFDLAIQSYEEARNLSKNKDSRAFEEATHYAGCSCLRKAMTDVDPELWIASSKIYFNEVIEQKGTYLADAYCHLGYGDLILGHNVEKNCRMALQKNPDSANAYYVLGSYYHVSNNFGYAISNYKKAIKRDPQNVKCLYKLALAYEEKGKHLKAFTYYNRAIQLNEKRRINQPYTNEYNFKPILGNAQILSERLIQIDQAFANPQARLVASFKKVVESGQFKSLNKETIFAMIKELPKEEQIRWLRECLNPGTPLGKYFDEFELSFFRLSEIRAYLRKIDPYPVVPPQRVFEELNQPTYIPVSSPLNEAEVPYPVVLPHRVFEELNQPTYIPVSSPLNEAEVLYPVVPPQPVFEELNQQQSVFIAPPSFEIPLYPVPDEVVIFPSAPIMTQHSTGLITQTLAPVLPNSSLPKAESRTGACKDIENYLIGIRDAVHDTNKWQRKNLFGKAKDIPEHIGKLQNLIEKEQDFGFSTDEELEIKFNAVLKVFINANEGFSGFKAIFTREKVVSDFYDEQLKSGNEYALALKKERNNAKAEQKAKANVNKIANENANVNKVVVKNDLVANQFQPDLFPKTPVTQSKVQVQPVYKAVEPTATSVTLFNKLERKRESLQRELQNESSKNKKEKEKVKEDNNGGVKNKKIGLVGSDD